MARYWFIVTVSGQGAFPVDMLRHDRLHPNSESDSVAIENSIETHQSTADPVRLSRLADTSKWTPTIDRWRSYGWHVEVTEYQRI